MSGSESGSAVNCVRGSVESSPFHPSYPPKSFLLLTTDFKTTFLSVPKPPVASQYRGFSRHSLADEEAESDSSEQVGVCGTATPVSQLVTLSA